MILEIRDIFLLPPILELSVNVPDITPIEFKNNVIERMAQDSNNLFIVDKKENKISGFVFCTVDMYRGKKSYVIQYAYIDPKEFSVGAEIFARVCQKARHLGLTDIYMMTSRNPEGFIKKYKFEPFMMVLKRSV